MSIDKRLVDIIEFNKIISFAGKINGWHTLNQNRKEVIWPDQGVYFFFEPGEVRSTSGKGSRVVRVGTHGLKTGSKSVI